MVFTFEDYRSLVRMLYEHPEWREELRPLVLSEELLRLPETQAHTDATLERMASQLDNLTTRVDNLTMQVGNLTTQVGNLTTRVGELALRTDAGFQNLDARVGKLDGQAPESRYFSHVGAWFGKWLRRPRLVSPDDLPLLEEGVETGRIDEHQVEQVRALDLIVLGLDRREPDRPETLLAVEVSVTVNPEDVERAAERADVLRRAGYRAFGFVGGENLNGRAIEPAARAGVLVDIRRP
jgi:hypothetical protein